RARIPDALMTLQQIPQILQTAVREATEASAADADSVRMLQLRETTRRAESRRETLIIAAVLWLSGLIWLKFAAQHQWLGWLQMGAAIALLLKLRSSKWRSE
ncbi:MAG: hypothetical protein ACLPV8_00740, partial [Steroidobacteraceae bacterium]